MADDEQIDTFAHTEENKPFFFVGVLNVGNKQRVLVVKSSCGFLERDFVLIFIFSFFSSFHSNDIVSIIIL